MTRRWRRDRPPNYDERGATALVVALLSTVLFMTAALTVDLGQMWVQKRVTQTQADLASLSAASWGIDQSPRVFPATTGADQRAMAERVAIYLNSPENRTSGQMTTSADELMAGTNGTVDFNDDGTEMTVVAPPAEVSFAFAQIGGPSSTDVDARAVVRAGSLQPQGPDLVPFWVPEQCGYGSLTIFGGNVPTNGKKSPRAAPAWAATPAAAVDNDLLLESVTPQTASVGSTVTVTMKLSRLKNNTTSAKILLSPTDPGGKSYTFTADFTKTTNSDDSRDLVFVFEPATVTERAATFSVQAEVFPHESNFLSFKVNASTGDTGDGTGTGGGTDDGTGTGGGTDDGTGTEGGTDDGTGTEGGTDDGTGTGGGTPDDPNTTPDTGTNGCAGSVQGNFGQLLSPRSAPSPQGRDLAMNLAEGLDHALSALPNTPHVDCTSPGRSGSMVGSGSGSGEVLDDVSRPGNNCITGDKSGNGKDGKEPRHGLIGSGFEGDGIGVTGRLHKDRGATRPDCRGGTEADVGGQLINDEVLSCYLSDDSLTLGDLDDPSANRTMLDQSVIYSPRFIWLPVVPDASNGWKPIKRFVPGFITDETSAATRQASDATASNGVYCNGNRLQCNSLDNIKAFVFHPNAIADDGSYGTITYDPTLVPVVRLVD